MQRLDAAFQRETFQREKETPPFLERNRGVTGFNVVLQQVIDLSNRQA